MLTTILAVAAATWGVVMAVAPLLQLRRMLRRRSSEDVSIGYLVVLLPGFSLWASYGIASGDLALVLPNVVAAVIAGLTIVVAVRLRQVASHDIASAPAA